MIRQHDVAYLGMYDFAALRPAQDTWWTGLAGHLTALGFSSVPVGLNRSVADPYEIWRSPDLFFAQTCGYPLTHRLAGKVRLLGAPCYTAPGCDGALYRSLYVVHADCRAESLSGILPCRVAINGRDSYSGWRALCKSIEGTGLAGAPFTEIIVSGGHANSIDLVRQGDADLAAIDCISHALIGDVEPERLAGTRVVDQSLPAPGLPYITRVGWDKGQAAAMVKAIEKAFEDPALEDARRALRLAAFRPVPLADYEDAMG